ncbi:MAG: hypothetical protein QOF64_7, partial [Candidatus Binatota bacterium]|nr:hypothetical protein [Candidatus Binatota bacterium]
MKRTIALLLLLSGIWTGNVQAACRELDVARGGWLRRAYAAEPDATIEFFGHNF